MGRIRNLVLVAMMALTLIVGLIVAGIGSELVNQASERRAEILEKME